MISQRILRDSERATKLGYDAAQSSNRRKAPSAALVSEDEHLKGSNRKKLIGGVRDLTRNFGVACWMIRKHLDFVSSFNFQSRTGDTALDNDLESFVRHRAEADRADVRRVHPLRRLVRMSEARSTIDGDVALLKLRDGAVQAIEGDRIADPDRKRNDDTWFQGIKTNRVGRPTHIAVHRRDGRGFALDKIVPFHKVLWHAAYDTNHRFDCTRGVGPVVTAIDDLRDVYEGKAYALAKLKVAQMFGLCIYSENADGVGSHTATGAGSDTSGDGVVDQERYNVDFGKGPLKMELDGADRAEFLEAKSGSGETVSFLNFVISIALKSLDLPYSFWDESHTNFFGSKMALILYLQSAARKRENVRDLLNAWFLWQANLGIATGELSPAIDLSKLVAGTSFDWIPSGLPWFDRAREVGPAIKAIGAGLDTHSRLARELYGMRFEDLVNEAKRDQRLVVESGVVLPEFAAWYDNEGT